MHPRFRSAVLLVATGGHGFVVQVVLLRELMAAFAGNELSAGVLLAVWVACEALGAWLFGRLASEVGWAAVVGPVSALWATAAVLGVILSRPLLHLLPGEALSIPGLAAAAAMTASLPALLHGGLFVLGVRTQSGRSHGEIGRGYVWEGVGTVAAAALVWFLLLPRLHSLALVALLGLPLVVASALMSSNRGALVLAGVCAVAVTAGAFAAGRLEAWAWERHWPGERVVRAVNSAYGKVLELERQERKLVVYDGVIVLSLPQSEPILAEELGQLPLLVHPNPKNVLVLGRIDVVPSVLKQPVERVVLVMLDRAVFDAAVRHADPELRLALADSRFRFMPAEPRRFLAEARERFDCVILGEAAPSSLAGNRLFSLGFFELCRERLGPDGILAMAAPGSAGRGVAETGELLRTRLRTASAAFDCVELIVADFPLVVASGQPLQLNPDSLANRLSARNSVGKVLVPAYLRTLLDPFRRRRLDIELLGPDSVPGLVVSGAAPAPSLNTDARPKELFLNIVRENRISSPWFARLYSAVGRISFQGLLVPIVLLLGIGLAVSRPGRGHFLRVFAVGTSGFAGAAVATLAVFLYQVRFGSVYSGIGMLLAAFMLGTIAGGRVGTTVVEKRRGEAIAFLLAELGLVAAVLLLTLLQTGGGRYLFGLLLFAAGVALGVQFPIAGASLAGSPPAAGTGGRAVGIVTAVDLLGGFVGALVSSLFLAPVLGLAAALVATALVKGTSLACLVGSSFIDRRGFGF